MPGSGGCSVVEMQQRDGPGPFSLWAALAPPRQMVSVEGRHPLLLRAPATRREPELKQVYLLNPFQDKAFDL